MASALKQRLTRASPFMYLQPLRVGILFRKPSLGCLINCYAATHKLLLIYIFVHLRYGSLHVSCYRVWMTTKD
jgi:hypothetical protein